MVGGIIRVAYDRHKFLSAAKHFGGAAGLAEQGRSIGQSRQVKPADMVEHIFHNLPRSVLVQHVGQQPLDGWRKFVPFQTARQMIRKGDIGRPLTVYCRGKEDERGGGEDMMVLGTHLFDLARYLFGDPTWVFGHVSHEGRDMTPADVREPTEPVGPVAGDEIMATFGFPGNVHCHFESRRGMFTGGPWRFGITVAGTKAKLAFRYGEEGRILRICRSPAPFEEAAEFEPADELHLPDIPGDAPPSGDKTANAGMAWFTLGNRRAVWDLLRAARNGHQPLSSGCDARWALEMIQGVYASHLAKVRLPLPLTDRVHPLA